MPVLGGQEKAADQIVVTLMILASEDIDSTLLDRVMAIAAEWMLEWQEEVATRTTAFWDVHPLTIQRFYDITCLTCGAHPDTLEVIRNET